MRNYPNARRHRVDTLGCIHTMGGSTAMRVSHLPPRAAVRADLTTDEERKKPDSTEYLRLGSNYLTSEARQN